MAEAGRRVLATLNRERTSPSLPSPRPARGAASASTDPPGTTSAQRQIATSKGVHLLWTIIVIIVIVLAVIGLLSILRRRA